MSSLLKTKFTEQTGVALPIIGGAMYPCSNPELVAAVSEAGGLGVIQPMTLTVVHRLNLVDGIRQVRALTNKPVGFNAIVEKSSKLYLERMYKWVDIALEEGVRFFITALGSPDWVVKRVHAVGGIVYHDVTELKFAKRALDAGVDGLICVNNRAGGHAGKLSSEQLWQDLRGLNVPLVCAGGIGNEQEFAEALQLGYAAVQLGTRLIATQECAAHQDYKSAIVNAKAKDVVLTDKISGVPVAVIRTPYVDRIGTHAGWVARQLLKHPKFKHYMRAFYSVRSVWQLKSGMKRANPYKDYFQAGKSVEHIDRIEPVRDILQRFSGTAT